MKKEDWSKKKIAVLIPCYNESKTVEKVVKDYKKVLPEADVYVYDNNSTDKTDKIDIAFFCGRPDNIKSNYKAFLENKIRENFRLEGVPINISFKKK